MVKFPTKVVITKCKKVTKYICLFFISTIFLLLYIKLIFITFYTSTNNSSKTWITELHNVTTFKKSQSEKFFKEYDGNKIYGYFKHDINTVILQKDNISISDLWPIYGGELEDRIEKQLAYHPGM